jgi:hypothetical protein
MPARILKTTIPVKIFSYQHHSVYTLALWGNNKNA